MKLADAINSLDHSDDAHWTKAGLPDLNVLKEYMGRRVTRAMVTEVGVVRLQPTPSLRTGEKLVPPEPEDVAAAEDEAPIARDQRRAASSRGGRGRGSGGRAAAWRGRRR